MRWIYILLTTLIVIILVVMIILYLYAPTAISTITRGSISYITNNYISCQDINSKQNLTLGKALNIANNSVCSENGTILTGNCQEGNWIFKVKPNKEHEACLPECTIHIDSQKAEGAGKCTGLKLE